MLATLGSLLAAVFFFVLYRTTKGRRRIPWPVPVILLFLTSTSLAVSPPVGWLMGKVADLLGSFGLSAAGTAALTIVVLLVALVLDLMDKKPDGVAKTALIVIPLLAVIASGPVGDAVRNVNDGVARMGTNVISTVTGE
ncbi:hypothetical protein [Saccharomonospora glauca]|uniref:Uncharacterized protein n=1 Tax=Saccharomonospora glauca K62 TaxID=928724 RepID=I1D8G6_9PSEU|nr:hypothetical protein [Saccharomonospora glauca]EIF01241.1 hypothetical protein SacglDRAFT_00027 [Saccharomonospora glauca K62]